MRGVYQSADHPERMRLVFTSQLHHQLQTLARGREIHAATPPQDAARRGFAAPRSREINGWELEKKVVLLKELRPLLERPFFLYADGDAGAAGVHTSSGSSGVVSFFSLDAYFSKTLPLVSGQNSLLDVWEYLLDMCEYVPVRNRCRSLYLHAAACICRRVEFIRGYVIDGQVVDIGSSVHDRYYEMLRRCIDLCSTKLTQSRVLLEENALLMAHVYSTVCTRFPSHSGAVFDAVVESTRVLEDTSPRSLAPCNGVERARSSSEPQSVDSYHHCGGSAAAKRIEREIKQCRSPRQTQRNWNGLTDIGRRNSEIRPDERMKGILSAFSKYKQVRRVQTAKIVESESRRQRFAQAFLDRHTVESSLCRVLEVDMGCGELIAPDEVAFIQSIPTLHAFSGEEAQLLQQKAQLRKDLELGLTLFTERLQKPCRDDVLLVDFIGAFLGDHSYWCEAVIESNDGGKLLWHCIPGYFCVVRAFVALFKLMCQRRPRQTAPSTATVGNILSTVHGQGIDVWSSYWSNREIALVMGTLSEVAKNTRLVNIFVKIVLEGTNILDPASVNYSISILQRVMETAAASASGPTTKIPDSSYTLSRGNGARHRGNLGTEFDEMYFCDALRKALLSSHVQILLKTLTFLYSCLDLLPSRARRRIVSELVIRENFFRLFLHWNEEIRKIYIYMIAFKVFASSRLDLPCTSDHILLSRSPFFHSRDSGVSSSASMLVSPLSSSPSFGYWSHFSDIAQSMLKSPSSEEKRDQRRSIAANGLANLIAWDSHGASLARNGSKGNGSLLRRISLFRASLDDDEVSVDLLVASKLDASLKMLADQVSLKKVSPAHYFPVEQEAYAERALVQYVDVLWDYYTAASARPLTKPAAPKLEFTISSPFAAD